MTLILVVDDEAAILEVLSAVLQEEGYQVETASNGREGLDCLERALPALVISDVMMSAVRPVAHLDGCPYAALLDKPFEIGEMLSTVARLAHPGPS